MNFDGPATIPPFMGGMTPGAEAPPPPFLGQGKPPDAPAGFGPGMGPDPFAPSPPPPPELTKAPKLVKTFQAVCNEYVTGWMKTSADMVRQKLDRWKLLEDLYQSRRRLSNWHQTTSAVAADPKVVSNTKWQTDFIVSCAPVVHSFVDRLYNMLFSQEQYWRVTLEPSLAGGNVEDPDFPTSQKFQALLLQKNRQSFFTTRIYELLTDYALFGTCFGKTHYYTKDRFRWKKDPLTGQTFPEAIHTELPIVEAIPLHAVLPDWTARHSDVQRWQGIGHRIQVPVERVRDRFDEGMYDLNRKEFDKQYPPGVGSTIWDMDPQLWRDPSTYQMIDQSLVKMCCLWEWHGEVPVPAKQGGGHQEIVATFVTNRPEDEPTSGIMIRCEAGPALETGLRPFVVSHFVPLASVFGMGAVEPNLDLIYYMSHMINVVLDNARLSTNVMLKVRRGSSAHRELARGEGDAVFPGKTWAVDDPGDVTPFEPLHLQEQAMTNLIGFFEHQYERRTSVSDTTLAMSAREKTATEAYQLGQMADVPLEARARVFVENLFEPTGQIFLGMLQHRIQTPQIVTVPDMTGRLTNERMISVEELRTGTYRVKATTNQQDQTKIARLQSIERALPLLGQMRMPLLQENIKISTSALVRHYLELAGLENVDQVLMDVPAEQAQAELAQMMGPPPGQGPPGGPPGQGGGPPQLGKNGTPNGPDQSDPSIMSAMMQQLAQQRRGDSEGSVPQ